MLLSIIIPTKNGQFTAIFALASALRISHADVEVIVQDCSDDDSLRHEISKKFGNDNRVKYFYSADKPSMTENWNLAFSYATGDYVCGIGDDDAVLKEIYDVAAWAKSNNINAVVQSFAYTYSWPGFYNQVYNGTFRMSKTFTGKLSLRHDLKESIATYGSLHQPMGYTDLPSVYHALISKNLLATIKEDTGKLLDSTSFDVYTAVAFSKYIQEYAQLDYPFSLKGASAKSNSQRMYTQNAREHFSEFKNLKLPELLPSSIGLHTTVAESYIVAAENTHRPEMVKQIDLPFLYANIACNIPTAYDACVEKLNTYAPGNDNRERFDKIYTEASQTKKKLSQRGRITGFIKKYLPIIYKAYLLKNPYQDRYSRAKTILDAIDIHENAVQQQRLSPQLFL